MGTELGHSRNLSVFSTSSAPISRCISLRPSHSQSIYHEVDEQDKPEVGTEPGINVRTAKVLLKNAIGSEIMVVDYSDDNFSVEECSIEAGAVQDQVDGIRQRLKCRPQWSKVRWVNVNGLSWEAIEPIAEYYDLHPLAVEDMLEIPQQTKLEVYSNQIFCRFALHLLSQNASPKRGTMDNLIYRLYQALRRKNKKPTDTFNSNLTFSSCETDLKAPSVFSGAEKDSASVGLSGHPLRSIQEFAQKGPLPGSRKSKRQQQMSMEQVSMFILENTVITFFERSAERVYEPILNRLSSNQTILRQNSECGYLAQAILDTSVDLIYPINRLYRHILDEIQIEAIRSPTLSDTRELHRLMTELTNIQSSVGSLATMLRSFTSKSHVKFGEANEDSNDSNLPTLSRVAGRSSGPFCQTIISEHVVPYFGDVTDHAFGYVRDFEIMRKHATSVTTLIYSTITIRSNDAVRMLSLVAVVFLPLSFLTGYFGMNFSEFDSLQNDVGYYWAIAAPFTVVLMTFLTYSWVYEKVCELRSYLRRRYGTW